MSTTVMAEAGASTDSLDNSAPIFEVVKGELDAEELAALTAVLLSAASDEETPVSPAAQPRTWVRRAILRVGPTPGPLAWRRSGWR